MPSIGDYVDLIKVGLGESGKYFALLVFSVLAIRLWRRWRLVPVPLKPKCLMLACAATVIAAAIGIISIRQSLGLLYSYYGTQALREERLAPALSLFQTSLGYWKNADTLGKEGLCLLWLEKTGDGIRLLDEAKSLRGGKSSPFEEFYEGLYFFYQGKSDTAAPLLEAASGDQLFRWPVTKLFAVIQLDRNQPHEAALLMAPFVQAEVTETDQAYVMASLKLADGKKSEALALVDKFSPGDGSPFWKSRFEKLRAQIQKQP